jgi:hypothetical protein
MPEANIITEDMDVIGSDGAPVGTVSRVEGDRIKLTSADGGAADRYVPFSLVQAIRGNSVTLTQPAGTAIVDQAD